MKDNRPADWDERTAKMIKEHPALTYEDFDYHIDKEEEMLERLVKKLNKNKQEIRKWLHLMG